MKVYMNNKSESVRFNDEKQSKIHREDLGLVVPEDYFAQSKNQILMKTVNDKSFTIDWFLNKKIIWKVAASMVIALGIGTYFQYSPNTIQEATTSSLVEIKSSNKMNQSLVELDSNQAEEKLESIATPDLNKKNEPKTLNLHHVVQDENDILVKSLFVEEAEVDQYLEKSILEDI